MTEGVAKLAYLSGRREKMKPTAIILSGDEPAQLVVTGRICDSGGAQLVLTTHWDSRQVGGSGYVLLSISKARELVAALVAHAEALERPSRETACGNRVDGTVRE